jgi:hypothetical protein
LNVILPGCTDIVAISHSSFEVLERRALPPYIRRIGRHRRKPQPAAKNRGFFRRKTYWKILYREGGGFKKGVFSYFKALFALVSAFLTRRRDSGGYSKIFRIPL